MAPLPLTFASGLYDRVVPLATGEVRPKGVDLNFLEVTHPRDIFDRMVGGKEFDLSELSASEYITRHVAGDRSFVAIPVFPSRVFRHGFIAINTNNIKNPSDLNGKRIGVQLYTMTAAVWQRGILQHECGVDLSTIEWVEGKMEGPGAHGKPTALPTPRSVRISRNDSVKSLSDLLEAGEIDATIGADPPTCLGHVHHVQRLFPNFRSDEKAYYKRTGIFPIMHLVAMRRQVYEQHPFAASSLYEALNESKEIARRRMNFTGALRYMLPWLSADLDEIRDTFGEDCWPYGLEPNRKTLEALVQHLYEQSMIERPVPIEELFVPAPVIVPFEQIDGLLLLHMLGKIALEECWMLDDAEFNATTFGPKGVIGDDLTSNLIDVHGQRLQQMDENGLDHMVLSLVSPGAQGQANKEAAEELATKANDRLEEEVMKNPARFSAMVALSMHDPAQAADELRRCWTQHKGFVGVLLNDFQSSGQDGNTMLFYDVAKYDVFWEVADELRAPVYIHPRSSTPLITEHMWKDRPWLNFSALGYANRVNMHLLGIITAGVLDRFPNLKLVVGHMGEHIPYDLYRIDHKLNRARFPNMPLRKDRLVRDYFGEQVFITTSGHFSSAALVCAMTEVGAHSIMFSVDYPFESIPNGCVWFDEHSPLSERDTVNVGRNNCLSVFPRLLDAPHGLIRKTPKQCGVGGLHGEVEFGLYNNNWSRRLERR